MNLISTFRFVVLSESSCTNSLTVVTTGKYYGYAKHVPTVSYISMVSALRLIDEVSLRKHRSLPYQTEDIKFVDYCG